MIYVPWQSRLVLVLQWYLIQYEDHLIITDFSKANEYVFMSYIGFSLEPSVISGHLLNFSGLTS